jgi:hypothetical protein
MEELHRQSVEAFIASLCSKTMLPSFDELAYRMEFNIGWELSSMRHVFLTINRIRNKQVYKHHSDTAKIKAASLRHRDYLRSQLTK